MLPDSPAEFYHAIPAPLAVALLIATCRYGKRQKLEVSIL